MAEILLITDTIENQIPNYYFDLLGVAELFHGKNINSCIIVASSKKVEPKVSGGTGFNPELENVLGKDLNHPNPVLLSGIVQRKYTSKKPDYICLPHTMRGCQIASDIAVKLKGSLISGVEEITFSEDGPVFKRNLMNGKWIADITPENPPVIFTVNQGAFTDPELSCVDGSKVKHEDINDTAEDFISLYLSESEEGDNPIEDAEVVVGAGRGAEESETMELIKIFAKFFKNSALGASRPLCDSGVFPYSSQIGETGKQISPKVYIACGISGSNQHIAGVKQAQTFVAINKDPQAAIFRTANIGIVEDINTFIPVLLENLDGS